MRLIAVQLHAKGDPQVAFCMEASSAQIFWFIWSYLRKYCLAMATS